MSDDALPVLPAVADTPGPADVVKIPRKRVWAWALWDWAAQPFNTVILTFVFTALYLTSDHFIEPSIAALGQGNAAYDAAIDELTSQLGMALTIGGILIALLAPVMGQRADARGRRKAWLGIMTVVLVIAMGALYFVKPEPGYFILGISLIAFGSIVGEIAGVNYNAMLVTVSTPRTVGRVSGLGWGLGYVGGIFALVIIVVATTLGWFPDEPGMAYRLIAVGCAIWTLIFAWPLFLYVPEAPPADAPRVSLFSGYVILWRSLRDLWTNARSTLWFLLASAVYRDGLAGVFAFGAVLASVAYGFTSNEVMVFGIAANLIAGISTIVAGRFDDRLGPRKVIITTLVVIVVAGAAVVVFFDLGTTVFWIFGLLLSAMVGPAQAASRSLLARVSPAGREAEIFGLYATTGRAVSFLAPAAWTASIAIFGSTIFGTIGIISVVLLGLVLMLFVRTPADKGVR